MIESLDVVNFQSHTSTHVDFDPGINVFVGESDVGKSALLRALEWLDTNRPVGDWMQTHGTNQTNVKAVVAGIGVERRRGAENLYVVGGKELGAFRMEVPVEVTATLGLSDLNFSSQHSSPFLISMSPGQAASYLNEIIKLDKIDKAMDWITRKKKVAENQSKELDTKMSMASQIVADLSWVPSALDMDKELAKATEEGTAMAREIVQLKSSLAKFKALGNEISGLEALVDAYSTIWDEASNIDKQIEIVQTEIKGIKMIHSKLKLLNEEIRLLVEEISEIPESTICALCGRPL